MTKRVAVVTTGGTIGSVFSQRAIVPDALGSHLHAEIERFRADRGLEIDVFPALEKMSENMAPTDWLVIIRTINGIIKEGYRSIIVTHGTDTLAYTAAALSIYFNENPTNTVICLTGAFYPLSHPASDARANLEAALEVAISEKMQPGVYLSFQAEAQVVGIYHGLEISPMTYDSSAFGAMYGKMAAKYVGGELQEITPRNLNLKADCDFPSAQKLQFVGQKIYQVAAYPGLDLSVFSNSKSDQKLILIDGYHSGTASSDRFAGTIIDFKIKNPGSQIALCCVPTKFVNIPYESTLEFVEAGVLVYGDIPSLSLYVLAACRYAAGVPFESILQPVSSAQIRADYAGAFEGPMGH